MGQHAPESTASHEMQANIIKKSEREVAFNILPTEFYKLAEGYVSFKELKSALSGMGFDLPQLVRLDNLTLLCSKTRNISAAEVVSLIKLLEKLIKKQ